MLLQRSFSRQAGRQQPALLRARLLNARTMRALTAFVLLGCGLHATCLPPLARMMQASEQTLVNEGLEEGREAQVCFDVVGRSCWCRVPAAAATS